MQVLKTRRLNLRWQTVDDATFILELINDPSWIKNIGDRGIRTLEAAQQYIQRGAIAMYTRYGHGLYLVESSDGAVPLGICGLIKRDGLDDVDIGFAFLPRHWGQGYAYEAAAAVMTFGNEQLGLKRIVGITSKDNQSSARLLEKVGLRFERMVTLPGDDEELRFYAWNAVE